MKGLGIKVSDFHNFYSKWCKNNNIMYHFKEIIDQLTKRGYFIDKYGYKC